MTRRILLLSATLQAWCHLVEATLCTSSKRSQIFNRYPVHMSSQIAGTRCISHPCMWPAGCAEPQWCCVQVRRCLLLS